MAKVIEIKAQKKKKKKKSCRPKKKIKLSNWPCERGTWTLSIPLKRYSKQIQMTRCTTKLCQKRWKKSPNNSKNATGFQIN